MSPVSAAFRATAAAIEWTSAKTMEGGDKIVNWQSGEAAREMGAMLTRSELR